jgi:outer membrane protein TolC
MKRWIAIAFLCALPAQAEPIALSFADARSRLSHVSDSLAAARANLESKSDLQSATRHLRWPELGTDIRDQRFQKTLDLPLGSLAPIAGQFGLHDPLRFKQSDWRFRPTLTATVPLYSAGQIPAAQHAAAAATRQAAAERETADQALNLRLVEAYFGQQLAERASGILKGILDGLQRHLEHAEALEHEGFATKAQRLQAVVARDRAEREYRRSLDDLDTAYANLANLLHVDDRVAARTPLFVITSRIEPVEEFQRAAEQHPQVSRLRSISEQAVEAAHAQEGTLKPQAFAFGIYDFYRHDAAPGDADWAYGVGIRYTIVSSSGRRERLRAAWETSSAVEASLRELRSQLKNGVTRDYNDVETARTQYLLLESTIESDVENLRLQTLSFQEGEGTSLDVIDAEISLGQALIDRARAAYQFDVALARLLDVSGLASRYVDLIRRADRRLESNE